MSEFFHRNVFFFWSFEYIEIFISMASFRIGKACSLFLKPTFQYNEGYTEEISTHLGSASPCDMNMLVFNLTADKKTRKESPLHTKKKKKGV